MSTGENFVLISSITICNVFAPHLYMIASETKGFYHLNKVGGDPSSVKKVSKNGVLLVTQDRQLAQSLLDEDAELSKKYFALMAQKDALLNKCNLLKGKNDD